MSGKSKFMVGKPLGCGDAVADASTGEFIITLSGALVEGQATLTVKHAGYVDFTDTLAVATA